MEVAADWLLELARLDRPGLPLCQVKAAHKWLVEKEACSVDIMWEFQEASVWEVKQG